MGSEFQMPSEEVTAARRANAISRGMQKALTEAAVAVESALQSGEGALAVAKAAIEAASRNIRFEPKMCPACGGAGLADPDEIDLVTPCPACAGGGYAEGTHGND
jgi:hypothetical protein